MEGEFKFSPRFKKMNDNAVAYETLSDNVTETTRKVRNGGNDQVVEGSVAATPQVRVFERRGDGDDAAAARGAAHVLRRTVPRSFAVRTGAVDERGEGGASGVDWVVGCGGGDWSGDGVVLCSIVMCLLGCAYNGVE